MITLPIPQLTDSELSRFLSKIVVRDTGCWGWLGKKTPDGYGCFSIKGRYYLAHRISHVLWIGPLADGVLSLHTCDTPECSFPDHLFKGDQFDNIRDAAKKERLVFNSPVSFTGESNINAKLTPALVREIRSDRSPSRQIASRLGVSKTTVLMVRSGQIWGHVADV